MDLFKLLGTVAVDVKDALEAFKKVKDEGDKTESKLSKVFSGIGKGAAVAGKVIGAGLLAGATAMGTLTVKALGLSGDLEQNMGGAESVFKDLGNTIKDMAAPMQVYDAATGKVKESTSTLEEVSKQAYKNMGLSQSDYLATANKMGALFKGAGFETQEALNMSSQAMQRAADVASIMGIDTQSAMDAVANAAKGNFTMMDNLGIAMNDTAIGAYALEKGINKSTSEMTQQEKIGLAMEMFLDKTSYAAGNYAKENETLAGSLGTAKSALSNFLAGSGDVESLVSSFSGLANVVVNSLKEIAPRLTTGLADLVNQVMPLIPPLLQTLLPVLVEGAVTLINGLVAALPAVISALMAVLPALIQGVQQIINALIQALPQIMQALVGALPTLIPLLINALVSMIVMLCQMLPQIIQPIIDNLPMIIASIVTALLNNLPALIMGAIQLVMGLVAALPQIFAALIQAIPLIFQGIWESIKNVFSPVTEWFSNMWNSLGNVPGLSSMKTMIENVWGAIKDYITTYINAIKNIVTTVWNSIKDVISTVINAIKNVISTAWNAIKTIISSVMKLISSVLKGDWEGVKSAISNILNAIKSVIQSIWNGILSVISSVLNGIKNTVSSIWNGIKSVISSYLNMIKTTVSSIWNGIKGAISGAVNGVKTTVTTGFNDVKNKVINAFNGLPGKLTAIGKNLVQGLWNGISNAKEWVLSKIKGFGTSILNGLKSIFGIHSPAKETEYDGAMLAEGLVVGIEKKQSEAEKAAEDLASATLDAAEKKLDEFKMYNELSLQEEARFWDAVRVQVKEGTDARLNADKKYLEAKKAVDEEVKKANESVMKENAKFIDAEKELQSELDSINESIKDRQSSILNTFSLFEKFTGGNSNPISRFDLAGNLQSQIKSLEMWDDELSKLEAKIGGTALFEEIKGMGVEALSQVQEINKMTAGSLDEYVALYDRRTELAGNQANKEMQDEANTRTQEAWQKFATKCAEIGANVGETMNGMKDVSVEAFNGISEGAGNIADKIDETLAKMKTAFESFQPKMKMPHFAISGELNIESGSVPSVDVEWYKKAMNNAMLLKEPTIFGYDQTSGKYLGGGDAGSEVVAGSSTLMSMIKGAVAEQNSTLTYYMQKLVQMLASYFPQLIEAFDVDIVLDSGVLVGELAIPMNNALGKLSSRKDRGR